MAIIANDHKTHGLLGEMERPDWPRLTLAEVDELLLGYPQTRGAVALVSHSPRPFSAGSVVATCRGRAFVKRHHRTVRDREGLLEEHRLIAHLYGRSNGLVAPVLADDNGETAIEKGEWTYEVHAEANGVDVYEQALSWTPFHSSEHARAAGRALATMHCAAYGYEAAARKTQQLVTSFTILDGKHDPLEKMEAYLAERPALWAYAERRDWRAAFHELHMPLYERLVPWLPHLKPLWTQNDFHASNLMWSGNGDDAAVLGVIDFGLADRTNAVHDLATAIERNIVEWLRMDDLRANLVHLDHLDALLAGYEELRPLGYEEARALAVMLPLVHCEFALSETDYFLSILHSEDKAYLAYEGYFLAHTAWFREVQGRLLLEHLERWANERRGFVQSRDRGQR